MKLMRPSNDSTLQVIELILRKTLDQFEFDKYKKPIWIQWIEFLKMTNFNVNYIGEDLIWSNLNFLFM